ncbi:MAG: hypothetical protein K9N10_08605 [Deltaproteobacteria bacterium]|nr:hypothetical protein [Deltaproteobacteria bacterium]
MNNLVKKWIISPSVVLLLFPGVCFADYLIRLKDGRSFTTDAYREEGEQIKFNRYGGVIGLPKDQVIDIEEIEAVPKEEVLKPPEPPPASENKMETAGVPKSPSEAAKTEDEKTADPKKEDPQMAFMKEKRRLLLEREYLSNAFKEAKAKNAKEEKDRCWNQLLQLQKKLEQLQNRVAEENNGTLPPWWEQIQ